MHWSAGYVGIPFAWDGYDRAGCGCWGLVWLVQREVFGRDLPRHDDFNALAAGGQEIDPTLWRSGIRYRPVALSDAADGDLLHMHGTHHGRRTALHIGVICAGKRVLHTELATGAIVEHLDSPRVSRRPIQAYRLV